MILKPRARLNVYRIAFMSLTAVCIYAGTYAIAHAASNEVLYHSDFSSDPAWTTDQPQNFYWDESEGALFARTINRPDPTHSPSRYYYTETALNPKISYELTWDMKVLTVSPDGDTSGVALFGLYGDRLHAFNELNLNFVGNNQDGSFSTRLMTIDRDSRFIFTDVNPGYNYDIGTERRTPFSLGTWYTITERYDAIVHQYHFTITERDTGARVVTETIEANSNAPVNPELQNLGITMHPEGTGATNLGYSNRINGFAEYLIDNVTLTQIYDETYSAPSSVLFLPGIQASRLYKDGLLGTEDQLWEPNYNGDVAQLEMTEQGESIEDIYTRDVLGAVFGLTDIYGSFETYLAAQKQNGNISDWKSFAYDWRYAVDTVVEEGTQYEGERVFPAELVKQLARDNNSRVTIITHSNGGLLAKALIAKLESEENGFLIDKLILIGSPQTGTPKAVGSVLHGYDQERLGGLIIDDITAREVIRNMPGAYGLLPSEKYITEENPFIEFDAGTATAAFIAAYGNTIDNPEEFSAFMLGSEGRAPAENARDAAQANTSILSDSATLHRTLLDTWVAPVNTVVHEFSGVGIDTVRGFRYEGFIAQNCAPAGTVVGCSYDPYYEPVPLFTKYGDETVVESSSSAYPGAKNHYYINMDEIANSETQKAITHVDMTTLPQLQSFITGILTNSVVPVQFIHTDRPTFIESTDLIAVHSPVSLSIIDTSGNLVGRRTRGDIVEVVTDIPGSSYLEIGGATYITVPSTAAYTATIAGIGEAGSYTLTVDTLGGNDTKTPVARFDTATVTPLMNATFSKTSGVFSDVAIDYDSNGTIDTYSTLSGEPTTEQLYATLRTDILLLVLLKTSERDWLISSVNKAEQTGKRKGNGSTAVLRIFSQIDGRLLQYRDTGKITITEYNTITGIMQEITTR